jgi:hypothetical protein
MSGGGSIVGRLKDNVEYTNRSDPGRELQSAMWYEDRVKPVPQDNPTEARDWTGKALPSSTTDLFSMERSKRASVADARFRLGQLLPGNQHGW